VNLDVADPVSKKIWVTAVTLGASAGADPSHPAFILPGQEMDSGNHRPVSVLEPCAAETLPCSSGTSCCSGFCIDGSCQPAQACARLDDRCQTSADCCNPAHQCVGMFCAEILGG
jgi:hypothetical protein